MLVVLVAGVLGGVVGGGGRPASGAVQREVTYSIGTAGSVTSDVGHFATSVDRTLNHPDGWSLGGSLTYRRVASGANVRILLASPSVIGARPGCSATWSCHVAGTVYINQTRWEHASPTWTLGLANYRHYVINHEVGHYLGLGHATCPAAGAAAPVMMQQSIRVAPCRNQVWPLASERSRVASRYGVQVIPTTAITRKYYALGGPDSFLGALRQTERATPDGRGRYAVYAGGRIYWSSASGAHEVHGSLYNAWVADGTTSGAFGFPSSDTLSLPGGVRYSRFQKGNIYAHAGGTFGVPQPYFDVYVAHGGHGSSGHLGLPTSERRRSADDRAMYQDFQRGRVYRRGVLVVEIHGAVFDRHEALGGVHGPLGHVASNVSTEAGGRGRVSRFENGSIWYLAGRGAFGVWGAAHTAYLAHGGPTSDVGYPTSDRVPVGDGRGERVGLESGAIYLTSSTGAHVVPGPVQEAYSAAGGPTGSLGYPIEAAVAGIGGAYTQRFEHGIIAVESELVPFVAAAYADFLGRSPTAEESAGQADALHHGTQSRAAFLRSLAYSAEYLATIVDRLYRDTLGRGGSALEVGYWVGRLRTGMPVARLAGEFYGSQEYLTGLGGGTTRTWVADLYAKVLGRDASPADLDFWTAQTAALGRVRVAHRIYESPESRTTRVRRLYQELLGRSGGAADVAYWAERILTEGDVSLAVAIAASQEYFERAQTRSG